MRAQLLLIFALLAIAFAAKDRVWSQVQATGTAPSPRFDFSYAFNPATNNFLVFGGGAFGGQFFGDFFAYNTNTNKWTTLPSGPAPRTDAAGALCNGLFYVAGGKNKTTTFSDMWHYNEATRVWTEVPSGLRLNSGALACSASSLIYNGGSDEAGVYSTKTYSYNKNTQTWSIVASTVQPAARQWTPLTYSPITSEFVLFGGWLGSSPADDLFVLSDSAKQWTSLTQGAHPTKRSGHAMAYDSSINQILLFGGEHFDGSTGLNDIWFFNPVTRVWTPTTARNAPPKGRLGAAAVYIGNNEYLVFGGVTGWTNFDDIVNDLWKLSSVPSACVVNGAISASNRWTENGETVRQYSASFKNDGTETAYAVDFTLALGAAQIKSSWNIRQYGTSSTFALSNFYSLNPAQTYSGAGFIASGNAAPVLSSVSPVCYRNSASIQATCSSVKVTAILRSGATYLQNGELRSEYDLTITNTGPSSFNSLALTIVPSDGVSSIQSSWNIQQVGTSQSYNVDLFGGPLAAGQTYTNTHGFIWAGPATFQVRCAPSA